MKWNDNIEALEAHINKCRKETYKKLAVIKIWYDEKKDIQDIAALSIMGEGYTTKYNVPRIYYSISCRGTCYYNWSNEKGIESYIEIPEKIKNRIIEWIPYENPTSALNISRYIIRYASEHGFEMTNFKLQKLMYFLKSSSHGVTVR